MRPVSVKNQISHCLRVLPTLHREDKKWLAFQELPFSPIQPRLPHLSDRVSSKGIKRSLFRHLAYGPLKQITAPSDAHTVVTWLQVNEGNDVFAASFCQLSLFNDTACYGAEFGAWCWC